jgi:DNA repair exonuclease SbcCD ATPase subunit
MSNATPGWLNQNFDMVKLFLYLENFIPEMTNFIKETSLSVNSSEKVAKLIDTLESDLRPLNKDDQLRIYGEKIKSLIQECYTRYRQKIEGFNNLYESLEQKKDLLTKKTLALIGKYQELESNKKSFEIHASNKENKQQSIIENQNLRIENLMDKISELEKGMQQLEEDKQQLEEDKQQLEEDKQQLEKDKKTNEKEIYDLKRIITEQQEEYDEILSNQEKIKTKIFRQKEEIQKMKDDIKLQSNKEIEYIKDIQDFKNKMQKASDSESRIKKEFESLKNKYAQVYDELENYKFDQENLIRKRNMNIQKLQQNLNEQIRKAQYCLTDENLDERVEKITKPLIRDIMLLKAYIIDLKKKYVENVKELKSIVSDLSNIEMLKKNFSVDRMFA